MPLDENLCSFSFSQLDEDRNIVIIAQDQRQQPTYYKRRVRKAGNDKTNVYLAELTDPYSQAVLGAITSPNIYGAVECEMKLFDPDLAIRLHSTGKIRFDWQFDFEGHIFRLRKSNALASSPTSMILEWHASKAHKYDPSIAICHLSYRAKQMKLTMLDYNIERLQISDLKGFEVCCLLSVLFVADLWYAEGAFFQFPCESDRLKQYRTADQALEEDAMQGEAQAGRLREDQARHQTSSKFSQLLKRRKSIMTS